MPLKCLDCQPKITEKNLFPQEGTFWDPKMQKAVMPFHNVVTNWIEYYIYDIKEKCLEQIEPVVPPVSYDPTPVGDRICIVDSKTETILIRRHPEHGHVCTQQFINGEYQDVPNTKVNTLQMKELKRYGQCRSLTHYLRLPILNTSYCFKSDQYIVRVPGRNNEKPKEFYFDREFSCFMPSLLTVPEDILYPEYSVWSESLKKHVTFTAVWNGRSEIIEQYVYNCEQGQFEQVHVPELVYDPNHEVPMNILFIQMSKDRPIVIMKDEDGNFVKQEYDSLIDCFVAISPKDAKILPREYDEKLIYGKYGMAIYSIKPEPVKKVGGPFGGVKGGSFEGLPERPENGFSFETEKEQSASTGSESHDEQETVIESESITDFLSRILGEDWLTPKPLSTTYQKPLKKSSVHDESADEIDLILAKKSKRTAVPTISKSDEVENVDPPKEYGNLEVDHEAMLHQRPLRKVAVVQRESESAYESEQGSDGETSEESFLERASLFDEYDRMIEILAEEYDTPDEQTPCTKFEEYPDESDEESDQSDDESDFSYMAAPSESEDSYDKLVENFSQDYQKLVRKMSFTKNGDQQRPLKKVGGPFGGVQGGSFGGFAETKGNGFSFEKTAEVESSKDQPMKKFNFDVQDSDQSGLKSKVVSDSYEYDKVMKTLQQEYDQLRNILSKYQKPLKKVGGPFGGVKGGSFEGLPQRPANGFSFETEKVQLDVLSDSEESDEQQTIIATIAKTSSILYEEFMKLIEFKF